MNLSKRELIILWPLLTPVFTSAQDAQIDSLIQKLNNSQICLDGNYVGALICLRDGPALELYKIGKPTTKKLISILDDSTKGILAHIILSKIWQQDELPHVVFNEKKSIAVFNYNKLSFFVNPPEIEASPKDLLNNKFSWSRFLRGVVTPETAIQPQILGQPNENEIVFQVTARNVTHKPIEITSNRRESVKLWEDDHGQFNYSIELQKLEGSCYSLFGPSADINPTFELEKFIELKPGAEIRDTLRLPGYIFSRSGKSPGAFSPGEYRFKVYFRKTWRNSLVGESEWVKFTVF